MVQVHAAKPAFQRPDPTRIAALSGAMLLNLAGLMLLLIPIVMPSAPPRVDEPGMQIVWPEIEEPMPIKPVPPMPDAATIPRPQTPIAQPQPQTIPDDRPVFSEVAMPDTTATVPQIDVPPGDAVPDTGPMELGSSLASINPTPPKYPLRPLRQGIEGTVELRILVGIDGLPLRVEVDQSSGNRELDNEARRHVQKKWRFRPAVRDGIPVQAWGTVAVVFSLGRG